MVLYSREDILMFNEKMLGRGLPNVEDGVGYNKADYGICSTCAEGASYAQIAEVSKRLVKYCTTQLDESKTKMLATYEYFLNLAEERGYSFSDGVSIDIGELRTKLYFRFNQKFVDAIKYSIGSKWEVEEKVWTIDNFHLINVLEKLSTVGADTINAIEEAKNSQTLKNYYENNKSKVLVKKCDITKRVFVKFDFDERIVSILKTIRKELKIYNNQLKFWTLSLDAYEQLKERALEQKIATFVES